MRRRNVSGHCEGDVCIPPLGMTALTWGLFMGVSSNVRYQVSWWDRGCGHTDMCALLK